MSGLRDKCPGSQAFPTSFNGENTRCPKGHKGDHSHGPLSVQLENQRRKNAAAGQVPTEEPQ